MSNITIKAENLSKAYQLGAIGTGTISRDFERWYAKVRGKEDPFLSISETNDRSTKGSSDIVWSLKDINFEIEQGDAVGIIGRNGAGKSTLLKILSKVTAPTTGTISGKGRIASLLEVGTGFHPELSGRENIFLNGAILGMRKQEIKRKFDEIVDFAGVERYIDTPVKRYSSGMYVRLAFAVAAHLESEILIVDEVLAVGDAEFQKKCLGKMGDVSKGEGRTVLFVSHNISSILTLTNKCIYLANGLLQNMDRTRTVVDEYLNINNTSDIIYVNNNIKAIPYLTEAKIITKNNSAIHLCGEDLTFNFKLNVPFQLEGLCVSFQIIDSKEQAITYNWIFDSEQPFAREKGFYNLTCKIPKFKLYQGKYTITTYIAEEKGKTLFEKIENICPFEVEMADSHIWGWEDGVCVMLTDDTWEINSITQDI